MTVKEWQEFLQKWNADILNCDEDLLKDIPEAIIKSGWMGNPPATKEQIEALEHQLGKKLPPSYKNFLRVSNGWHYKLMYGGIDDLLPAQEVNLFSVKYQYWIDIWMDGWDEPVTDEEHQVYDDTQLEGIFKAEYLQNAVQISNSNDLEIYLLNPGVIDENGEWEAWQMVHLGAMRYRSFAELMHNEYENFIWLTKNKR